MRFSRLDDGMHYGYILRNCFTGEVVCSQDFETREEMEKALEEDLSKDAVIGKVFRTLPAKDK